MNGLGNLDQKFVTAAGVAGGAASWVLGNIKVLTEFFSFIGTLCGALLAMISLTLKLRKLWIRWRAERVPFSEPADVDDDIRLP